jgi:hypothetical protein
MEAVYLKGTGIKRLSAQRAEDLALISKGLGLGKSLILQSRA